MKLLRLSLCHCGPRMPVPAPPTAEERLAAFRAAWPAPAANAWRWKHLRDAAPACIPHDPAAIAALPDPLPAPRPQLRLAYSRS